MLRLAQPSFLLLLIPLGILAVLAWRWRRNGLRRRAQLADEHLLAGLGATYEAWRTRGWQLVVGGLGLLCWIVALANPQWGTRTRLAAVRSTEVVVALDVSASMLAADVAPSRLSRAQLFLSDLLDALGGERVGLVLFAGEAYLQTPLTSDYGAVAQFARSASPDRIGEPGTNFAAALRLCRQLLVRPVAPDAAPPPPARKLVIVVSDGENHEPDAETATEEAATDNVRIVTVGVGTAEGAEVPDDRQPGGGVKRDEAGNPVVSKYSPATLQQMASLGQGRYFDLNAGGRQAAQQVAAYVAQQNLGAESLERFEESASYFQLFVTLGLLAFGWAWWLGRSTTRPSLGQLRTRAVGAWHSAKPTPRATTLQEA